MDTATEIRRLERRAAIREEQADEREATAAANYGGGSYLYLTSLNTAEEYRAEAQQLRQQASRLRAQSNGR